MSVARVEREAYILDLLARDGAVSVSLLSRDLDVSEVTIRSQLKALEERGLLSRTRGGAQASSVRNVLERQREHTDEKERIAAAAAELVHDGDRIMIEAGTTTSKIPRYLVGLTGVQVVTNSALVFSHARRNTALTVILTGGTFHRESESFVGPVALRTIADFNVRLAFVGTDGFTVPRGLTTQFAEGAQVIDAMRLKAEETWLVADSSKFGRAGFVNVLPLAQLTGLITDDGVGPEDLAALRNAGPTVRAV